MEFSKDFWKTYKSLIKKRQAEIITPDEFALLIEMTDELESANVERIKQLVELSQSLNIPLKDLMKQLDIKPVQL